MRFWIRATDDRQTLYQVKTMWPWWNLLYGGRGHDRRSSVRILVVISAGAESPPKRGPAMAYPQILSHLATLGKCDLARLEANPTNGWSVCVCWVYKLAACGNEGHAC